MRDGRSQPWGNSNRPASEDPLDDSGRGTFRSAGAPQARGTAPGLRVPVSITGIRRFPGDCATPPVRIHMWAATALMLMAMPMAMAMAIVLMLATPAPVLAQQKSEKYAGYAPTAASQSADAKSRSQTQAKKKARKSKDAKVSAQSRKSSAANGRSAGVRDKTAATSGKSTSARGKSSSARGKTDNARARSATAIGKSTTARGKATTAIGKSTTARGKATNTRAKSANARVRSAAIRSSSAQRNVAGVRKSADARKATQGTAQRTAAIRSARKPDGERVVASTATRRDNRAGNSREAPAAQTRLNPPLEKSAVRPLATIPPPSAGTRLESPPATARLNSAAGSARTESPVTPAIRVQPLAPPTAEHLSGALTARASVKTTAARRAAAMPRPGPIGTWAGLPLLAGALGGLLLFRRRELHDEKQITSPHVEPVMDLPMADVGLASQLITDDLMQRAEPLFVGLRTASVRRDHEFILQHCTEDMATSLILDSVVADTRTEPQVEGLHAELLDLFEEMNRYVASVQYTADEQSGNRSPRKLREVWHFVREPEATDWRLAAVEAS